MQSDPYTGHYKAPDGVLVFIERKPNMLNYRVTYIDQGLSSTITMTEDEVMEYIPRLERREVI